MSIITMIKTPIEDLVLLQSPVHTDNRGHFLEVYREQTMEDFGLNTHFVQDNESLSKKGVLRGLHYQLRYPQGKLVRVSYGKIFDVAVDLRKESPTYGCWFGVELSGGSGRAVYIPEEFAHGFLTLSDIAVLNYKCTDVYHSEDEYGFAWNDSKLDIQWPIENRYQPGTPTPSPFLPDGTPVLIGEKDLKWPLFKV